MLRSLETLAQSSLIVLERDTAIGQIRLPADWTFSEISPSDPLPLVLERLQSGVSRIILIVSGGQFLTRVQEWKKISVSHHNLRAGFVVVADDPEAFLREKSGFVELLTVVSPKEAETGIRFTLLQGVRSLLRAELAASAKVNEKMLERLNNVFISLSAEKDTLKLLLKILQQAVQLTDASGGQLYIVEEADGEMFFKGRIVQRGPIEKMENESIKVFENNLCGYVALTGKSLNIPKLSELRPMTLPQFQAGRDYQDDVVPTDSVVTVPLKNTRNDIIGILQLVNKVSGDGQGSVPFEKEDESLLSSLATQGAICFENTGLYQDIQKLFEGFIKASVTAIESRDPSTGGHSERVADICVALARATSDTQVGIYRGVRFSEVEIQELKYAALLHDFGKIGVREEVLVKAKKLYAYQLESIKERIKVCKAAVRIAYLERTLKSGDKSGAFQLEYQRKLSEIESFWQIIQEANEPTVLRQDDRKALDRIRNEQLLLPDGAEISLLTEEEYQALAISKGSLTENERLEIESHVRHTYQFLKMIPWTRDFKGLTEIAYAHHEKLDGSGYPRGLLSHEIPLQSKIMTIADIYDALTAADRWYKEAVPYRRALDILGEEVALGHIDPVLYELFKAQKIYEVNQKLKKSG